MCDRDYDINQNSSYNKTNINDHHTQINSYKFINNNKINKS